MGRPPEESHRSILQGKRIRSLCLYARDKNKKDHDLIFYHFMRCIGRTYFRLRLKIRFENEDVIPSHGPFILVPNHVSNIDPFILHLFCPRLLFTFTKSSAFRYKIIQILGPKVGAFPTRRFRVDPQAIRVSLRLLERGKAVGVFPEGERSWDGILGGLRIGTVKFLLKAGVPVIPCGIQGTYEIAPRWGKFDWLKFRLKKDEVVVRYGDPIFFGNHDSRKAREEAFPEAMEKVLQAMKSVSG